MNTPLVLIGAGGHGRETLDVVEAINAARDDAVAGSVPRERFDFIGFVADLADEELLARRSAALITTTDALVALLHANEARYHLAIGDGPARSRLDQLVIAAGLGDRAVTLVHPSATFGSDLRIGAGVFMAAGARLTTNVTVGRHTHLNINAVVSHDGVIGEYVTLSPGVTVNGNVTIGDRTFLGTGAIVLPGRTIGADAIIGAGAVVTTDVPAGTRVVGIPARSS